MIANIGNDTTVETFGGCPHCGKADGCLNIGKSHWGFCRAHGVKWCIGVNLFSSWQFQTDAEWEGNAAALAGLVETDPVCPVAGPND
jgi:hypothetical protein